MKIIQLSAENVKRLRAVQITPDGSVVQITGRNGQGKSSVLDCIAMALGGEKLVCARPIRDGEKKGKVVINLGDLIVTRTFTEGGGGTLTVTNADGAKFPSPQSVLDKIVGKLTLDPLAFIRMEPKQQLETLKKLVGLDFSELDVERREAYAERTDIGRTLTSLQSQLAALPHHVDVPADEVSLLDLSSEFTRRQRINAENQRRRDEMKILAKDLAQCHVSIDAVSGQAEKIKAVAEQETAELEEELVRQIERLQAECLKKQNHIVERAASDIKQSNERLAWCQQQRQELEAKVVAQQVAIDNAVDLDPQEISQQMQSCDVTNRKVRENKTRANLESRVADATQLRDGLTAHIESIDAEKQRQLAAAKFPIPDLSFDDTGVIYKGVPFAQASGAEQLRASVAIVLAANPKFRVLPIWNGSLLDSEGLTMLSALADEHDAQIWLERVTDGNDVGIVIEDGRVMNEAAAAV